jgi:hypothetical protein
MKAILAAAALAAVALVGCGSGPGAANQAPQNAQQGEPQNVAPSMRTEEPTQQATASPGPTTVSVGEPVGYNNNIVEWTVESAEVVPGPRYNDLLNRQEPGPFLVMRVRFTNSSQEYLEVNDCLLYLYTDIERTWLCTEGSDTVPDAQRFDSEGVAPDATLVGTIAVKLREGEAPLYVEIYDQHPMHGGTPFARVELPAGE